MVEPNSRPTRPCLICGSNDWWLREALEPLKWLCGRCHPNPNKEGVMEQEVELINGKFVVKDKRKEVRPGKEKPMPKEYSGEVIALRDRVIKGNQRLFEAWLQIRELAHDTEEWSKQMDRWHEAHQKLHYLCLELKAKGYTDCLYIKDGEKVKNCLKNPDGFFCLVCPSSYPYWEVEAGKSPFKEE